MPFANHHGPDQRIRLDPAASLLSQFEGTAHPRFINGVIHASCPDLPPMLAIVMVAASMVYHVGTDAPCRQTLMG
jgi:hypothetical protein